MIYDIKNNSGVYKIINKINKKIYIGSSKDISKRWNEHKSSFINKKHHSKHLQRSIEKYGIDNFVFEVICYCDIKNLLRFEQKCLDIYKPWDREVGYNICKVAGSTLGVVPSQETRNKISASNKGKSLDKKRKNLNILQELKRRKIERVDLITGEIKEYASLRDANRDGFNLGNILRCCQNERPKHKGFYWKYLEIELFKKEEEGI